MTDLKSALEAAGLGSALEGAGVVNPAELAGVDTSHLAGATSALVEPPVQGDGLDLPPHLRKKSRGQPVSPPSAASVAPSPSPVVPPATVPIPAAVAAAVQDTGLGSIAPAQPVPPQPVVVNTPVPAPTPDVTPAAPTSGGEGSNQPANPNADKRAVLRAITQLGEQEGQGVNARAAFFDKVADAARLGAIVEDDAEAIQTKYGEGVAKAKGVGYVKMPSEQQQRSKIKTMIKLGALTGVRADVLLANVRDRLKKARDSGNAPKKSPADIYLTAARMQLSQPTAMLDDDQIDQAMASKAPDAKLEADLLYKLAETIDKLLDANATTPMSEDSAKMLEGMLAPLVQRTADLGGTQKQQREAAKLREKEEKLEAEKAKAAAVVGSLPGGVARHRTA